MSATAKKLLGVVLIVAGTVFYAFGGQIAITAGLSLIASGVAEKKAKSAGRAAFSTELQLSGDPNEVRKVIYGRAWTAGTLRYRNSTGADNRDFYMVVVLAGHACDGIDATQADREALTLDGSGNVTSPSKWVGLMNVRFLLGSDSQAADSTLDTAFANWTSNHRLRGCTIAIIKLSLDETNMNSVPQFRFLVRGRMVYDPRLDSTNGGSGSHRLATPSTWQWSENTVLCNNDYKRGVMVNGIRIAGAGTASTKFHWPNVIAEANVCDESVALAAGGNQKRYTANGIIDPRAQDHDGVDGMFEQAMAGDILWADGKWRYYAGAYRAPTLQLTPDHFVGPLKMIVHKSEADRKDTAHGTFASLADGGSSVAYSPVSLASATVGSEEIVTIDMPLVNDATNSVGVYDGGARCQRVAKLLLERDQAGKPISCTVNLYGLRAIPGESIGITHAAFGLTTQTMRVMDWQPRPFQDDDRPGLVVDLALAAGPSSLYAWSAEETAIGAAPALPQQVVTPLNVGWTPILVNVSRLGSTFTKTGGTDGIWTDAAVYSQEGYLAAAVNFRASQTNLYLMVGLNSDPTTDHNYSSLDYAIYMHANGNAYIFESNVDVTPGGSLGAYSTSDQFAITYDGLRVRYYKNATLLRTAPLVGARLFLDSSFCNIGAAVNSVTFGPITHVLANAVGWAADSQGKPAGVRALQSIVDRSQVSIVDGWMRITSTPDSTVVYGLPAIPVDPARTYQITVKWRSSGSSADGLYLIAYEYESALPTGITHVGNDASAPATVVCDQAPEIVSNAAMPGTTAVEQTFSYTPSAGTEFMSLGFGNYDPATASVYLEVAWAAMTELGSNVDLLPGVVPPLDQFQINPDAATEVYEFTEPGTDAADPLEQEVSITIEEDAVVYIEARANSVFGGSGECTWTPYWGGTNGTGIDTHDADLNPIPFPILAEALSLTAGTYDVGVRAEAPTGDASANNTKLTVTVVKR